MTGSCKFKRRHNTSYSIKKLSIFKPPGIWLPNWRALGGAEDYSQGTSETFRIWVNISCRVLLRKLDSKTCPQIFFQLHAKDVMRIMQVEAIYYVFIVYLYIRRVKHFVLLFSTEEYSYRKVLKLQFNSYRQTKQTMKIRYSGPFLIHQAA